DGEAVMKVFDLEYLFFKNLRRIKVYSRGKAVRQAVLRTAAGVFLVVAIFSNSGGEGSRVGVESDSAGVVEPGAVAGESAALEALIEKLESPTPPFGLTAAAVWIEDLATGQVLFQSNPEALLPPASTTKIMTALVALEWFDLDEAVTVPAECDQLPLTQNQVGFVAGEELRVIDVLYGLLVSSGSDAACTLASHRSTSEEFVAQMNQTAASLGMEKTRFTNSIGLDGENGEHRTSVRDLATLTRAALQGSVFRQIVGTRQVTLVSQTQDRWHELVNTNELLVSLPGSTGVKTGKTEAAGECLVLTYEKQGKELLLVILGSADRFGEARALIDWLVSENLWP
ncbi:serine hydrolase, partial [Candidatus Parcubacteria bacterium]|nr:serine hydrolase [Candidatus Parcubacteria bacterium]